MRPNLKHGMLSTLAITLACVPAFAGVPVVKTAQWDALNHPHTAINGVILKLGATVVLPDAHTYSVQWTFGDGSMNPAPFNVTNAYDISITHTYSACGVPPCITLGNTVNATVTVTDITDATNPSAAANYPIIMEVNNLAARVNIAIDKGLWYLHTAMWRNSNNSPVGYNPSNLPWGGWDSNTGSGACGGGGFACLPAAGLDSANCQAFLVKGHLETGPASDSYTEDAQRCVRRVLFYMQSVAVTSKQYTYNTALTATRCSNGALPTGYGTAGQSCPAGSTLINENPGATSCLSPPCTFTFDTNGNGQSILLANDSYAQPGYENGMLEDLIVATQNPTAVAGTGGTGILGHTYLSIAQDIHDTLAHCQWTGDSGSSSGANNGGGWGYGCQNANYDDNSVSQWDSIGLIGGNRGFGIPIPPVVIDANQVWMTWDQDWTGTATISGYANGGSLKGAYGYSQASYEPWGAFAVTPSGLVQLVMDQAGRTAAGASDQRWNMAENFYRDNFCNTNASAYYSPKQYVYGMYSFSKAMRLHNPGGVLTPITNIGNQPGTTNPLDWYGAQLANGDPCDGFAQTLVARQNADGHWFGNEYEGTQSYFDTAWSILILSPSVFVSCVSDLTGKGTAGGRAPARVDLTWTPMTNIDHYNVLRSAVNGGPYSLIGSSPTPAYSDRTGLSNMSTFYYVLQPIAVGGTSAVCQSNQAAIAIP